MRSPYPHGNFGLGALGMGVLDETDPTLPMLTPFNITAPLPSIASSLVPYPPDSCPAPGLWASANAWIEQNPALAFTGLAVAVAFFLALYGGGRKR